MNLIFSLIAYSPQISLIIPEENGIFPGALSPEEKTSPPALSKKRGSRGTDHLETWQT